MNYTSTIENGPAMPFAFAIGFVGFWVLLHITLAVGVTNDIKGLHVSRRETKLLGPLGWAYFTLISGPVGLAFYWVMHHSGLRDPQSDARSST